MATSYVIARVDPSENSSTGQYHLISITDDATPNTVVGTIHYRARAQAIADSLNGV